MGWQFWERKNAAADSAPPPPEDPQADQEIVLGQWPRDCYASINLLLKMFVDNAPPFSQWRQADARFHPDTEETARICAQSFALSRWFWLLERTSGKIAEGMARDAFIKFAEDIASPMHPAALIDSLLTMHDEALRECAERAGVDEGLTTPGEERPREYFLARYFLLRLPASPYYAAPNGPAESDCRALARCLIHVSAAAQEVFGAMHSAFGSFKADHFRQWKWSAQPGAHELHLMRRHRNPLFRPERQIVGGGDVFAARQKDAAALDAAQREAIQIRLLLRDFELRADWQDVLSAMRDRIDALAERVHALGRNAGSLQTHVGESRRLLMDKWRAALADKPEALAKFAETERQLQESRSTLGATEWLRQYRHPENVIPPDEIVPSLLTEDTALLARTVEVIETHPKLRPMLPTTRTLAAEIAKPLLESKLAMPGLYEKLRVLGVAMQA